MTSAHYFFAIPVPSHIRQYIIQWKSEEHSLLFKRWVHPADYHITLFFLGAAEKTRLYQFIDIAQQIAHDTRSFTVSLKQASYFGRPSSPRVFYIGVKKGKDLQGLQENIASQGEELGFNRENRPYHPHITLARKWTGRDFFSDSKISPITEMSWKVDTFVLYRTHVDQTPKYEKLEIIPLS